MPVKCTFVFRNLTEAAELERVKGLIALQAVGGADAVEVTADEGEDIVRISFVLPGVAAVPKFIENLKHKAGPDGATALAFEESGRQLSTEFRTVALRGSVKVSVKFAVTPGAQLYYSPSPGQETQVPADKISEAGEVTLDVAIARGQESIYARTVLGELEKCIKIDIFTGATVEIAKADYDARK